MLRCVVLGHVSLGCVGFFKDRLHYVLLRSVRIGYVCFGLSPFGEGWLGLTTFCYFWLA